MFSGSSQLLLVRQSPAIDGNGNVYIKDAGKHSHCMTMIARISASNRDTEAVLHNTAPTSMRALPKVSSGLWPAHHGAEHGM